MYGHGGVKGEYLGVDFDFSRIVRSSWNDYDGNYASRHDVTNLINI